MGMFSHIEPSRPDAAPESTQLTDSDGNQYMKDLDSWSCTEWRIYHENLLKKESRQKTINIVNTDYDRTGTFATVRNSCKWDCEWARYMKNEGYDVGHIVSDVYCGLSGAAEGVAETGKSVGSVGDFISDFTTKGMLMAGGLAGLSFWAFSDKKKKKKK